MSAPRVRIQYDQMTQIAARFGREAESAQAAYRNLRQKMEILEHGDWAGQGAGKFYAAMNDVVLPSLKRLAEALTAAQQTALRVSAILRRGEETAADIFRRGHPQTGSAEAGAPAGGGFWSQVGGFAEGVFEGAKGMAEGLWNMATNPIGALKGLAYGVTHPGQLWDALKKPYVEDWQSGNYGRALGRGAFEVAALLIPGAGEAKAVGEGAEAANIASKLAEVSDVAGAVAKGAKGAEAAEAAALAARGGRLADTFAVAEKAALVPKILEKSEQLAAVGRGGEGAAKLVDELAEMTTHGSGDRLVLGKWEEAGGYIAEAKANGGRWFETPKGLYDTLGKDLSWDVNQRVLQRQMESGVPRIDFVAEPVEQVLTDPTLVNKVRAQEVRYIMDNAERYGYELNGNSWTKVR